MHRVAVNYYHYQRQRITWSNRRRKEEAEEDHEASGRRRNTVTILLEAGVIEPNTALKLNLSAFSAEEQAIIEPEVESNPEVGLAEWTGLGLHKALRWRVDNKVYSATGLIKHILSLHGCGLHALPGPRYWRVPGGKLCRGLLAPRTKTSRTRKPETCDPLKATVVSAKLR
jgi:hypothetical protein